MVSDDPASPRRIGSLQQELQQALGADTVAALHRERWLPDAAATFVPPLLLAGSCWALGQPGLPAWAALVLVILNGWLFTLIALVAHDVAVHRMRWGRTGSWLHNAFAFGLMLMSGTAYSRAHFQHHAKVGTPDDPEPYQQTLDTRLRRWLFLTLPGVLYLRRPRNPSHRAGLMIDGNDEQARRHRFEQRVVLAFVLLLAAYAVFVNAKSVLLGYVLPFFIVSPLFNTMRIVLEHAEADERNRYWFGTNYRCGWLARALFLADSGDCHIAHHIYPRIPFYNCGRAAALIRPYVAERGVTERRSYWRLLYGWLVASHVYRSVWPADPAARR
ncbi:MAG TPA: fatty acid desaturase [Burkholderiaceae bacterium]|nr:fatty acid desaturase [Burkholderiaceae bacterium]